MKRENYIFADDISGADANVEVWPDFGCSSQDRTFSIRLGRIFLVSIAFGQKIDVRAVEVFYLF